MLHYVFFFSPRWRLCEEPSKLDIKNGVMHRPSQDSDVSTFNYRSIKF